MLITINDITLTGSTSIDRYDYILNGSRPPTFYRAQWENSPVGNDPDGEPLHFFIFKYDLSNDKWNEIAHFSWPKGVRATARPEVFTMSRERTLAVLLQALNYPNTIPSLNY